MNKFCVEEVYYTSGAGSLGDYRFVTELPEEQILIYLEEIFNSIYDKDGIRWVFLYSHTASSSEFLSWYEVNVATKNLDVSKAYLRLNGVQHTAFGIPDLDVALLMKLAWK
jgi:hypothetical protein